MTGYFLRICRDGNWQALDVAELTDKELEEAFSRSGVAPEVMRGWVISLAKWIRDNVDFEKPSET